MDGQLDTDAIDARIARLAERQHGVIGRAQLLALGLGRGAIESRLRRGWLHAVHRGVYAVGYRNLMAKQSWMAAVLACGSSAVLSHGSAAALWDLRRSTAANIHITVSSGAGRSRRPGIAVHRSPGLTDDEVTVHDAIPVTTVERTLLDIAADFAPGPLERAVERSVILRLFDLHAVNATLARHPKRKGALALRAVVSTLHDEPQLTRSELEAFFCDLCEAHCLQRPQINQVVEGLTVDFLWPDRRLVVETDGRATHGTPLAFERDRARDAALVLAGYRVVRFTYRQIVYEPERVARTVLALLAAPLPA
jgi:very-short-patch-repair endonuclease